MSKSSSRAQTSKPPRGTRRTESVGRTGQSATREMETPATERSERTKRTEGTRADRKLDGVRTTGGLTLESKFVDRDLCSVNPISEQFEPTDAMPIRQHNKMAGGG